MDKKVFAVIPAFNEEKTIMGVLEGIKKFVDSIIVVDDGSTDLTSSIAQMGGAIVLSHEKNQGYDKSLDDGFKKAADLKADIIFTFDADNQHEPQDIPKLINPIQNNETDISVGIRPKYARFSENIFAIISKRKIDVKDPLCGFKAYNIKVYEDIGYFDNISSIGTQLMFEAAKRGYRINTVNITLYDRSDESRFGRRINGNWRILKAIFKLYYYVWLR